MPAASVLQSGMVQDADRLRCQVRETYSAIAASPAGKHVFSVGRALAENLGYPPDLLDSLPESAVETFAGGLECLVVRRSARGRHGAGLGQRRGHGLDHRRATIGVSRFRGRSRLQPGNAGTSPYRRGGGKCWQRSLSASGLGASSSCRRLDRCGAGQRRFQSQPPARPHFCRVGPSATVGGLRLWRRADPVAAAPARCQGK
jgi:hypothetical protein